MPHNLIFMAIHFVISKCEYPHFVLCAKAHRSYSLCQLSPYDVRHYRTSPLFHAQPPSSLNTRQNLKPGHRTQNSGSATAHKPIMFTEIFKQSHLKQFSTVHDETQTVAPKVLGPILSRSSHRKDANFLCAPSWRLMLTERRQPTPAARTLRNPSLSILGKTTTIMKQ